MKKKDESGPSDYLHSKIFQFLQGLNTCKMSKKLYADKKSKGRDNAKVKRKM